MGEQRQDDQLEPIYNSSLSIQHIALKTSRERWTVGTCGERGSEISVLAAQYYYYHYVHWSFSHQRQLMVFHWSLSDSKSPHVSRTLLSILAILNNVVVWMVSTRPPTS